MKRFNISFIVSLISIGLFIFGLLSVGYASSSDKEMTELEGKWESIVKFADITFIFSGNNFSVETPNPSFWYKGTFTLHTDKDPKQIDLLINESGIPPYKGRTMLGIYKFEEDILVLVINQPGSPNYPQSFEKKGGAVEYKLKKE